MKQIFLKKLILALASIFLIQDYAMASAAMCSQLFITERVDGNLINEIALGKVDKSSVLRLGSISDMQNLLRRIFDSAVGPLNGIKVFGENGSSNYVLSYSKDVNSLSVTSLESNQKVVFSLFNTSQMRVLEQDFKQISPTHSKLRIVIQTVPRSVKAADERTNRHLPANFQKIELIFENAANDQLKLVHLKMGNSNLSSLDFFLNQSSLEIEVPDSVREFYNAYAERNNFDVFYSE